MAKGSSDDLPEDLPDEVDDERPEEGPVLSPDELDISKSEYVEELEEGRFVVSPNQRPPRVDPQQESDTTQPSQEGHDAEDAHATPESDLEPEPSKQPTSRKPQQTSPGQARTETQPQPEELSLDAVHDWLRRDFEQNRSRYAFDVTASFDGSVSQRRMASNDVVTIFESLMLWYAQQVDENTPVEEILGILLLESNVPVRYPPQSVHNLVKSADLEPDDTIADLLRAVKEDDGVQL